MNPHELYPLYQSCLAEASDLYRRKNADYGDAWQLCGIVGIFVRLLDKLQRANHLVLRGRVEVESETLRDTLLDAANYCLLGIMLNKDTDDLGGYQVARSQVSADFILNTKTYLAAGDRPLLVQFDELLEITRDMLKLEPLQIKLKIPHYTFALVSCANTCIVIAAKQIREGF